MNKEKLGIEGFIGYITHQKRYSKLTADAYKKDLEQFQDFLSHTYGISDLTAVKSVFIRDWIMELRDKHKMEPDSVNRKLSALRSFYKYVKRVDPAFIDPMAKITALKTPKPLPIFFRESEVSDVLSPEPVDSTSFPDVRNDIVLETLYDTGIRRAELISLKDSDFNFFSLTLRVWGKGGKERVIPISDILKEKAEHYIKFKRELFGDVENFIVTDKGSPAYPELIYRIVTNSMKKVSSLSKRSPHVMRHTFAGALLNSGAEINSVKELLGHASLAATQVYTHTSFEQMRQIYKNAHPRK